MPITVGRGEHKHYLRATGKPTLIINKNNTEITFWAGARIIEDLVVGVDGYGKLRLNSGTIEPPTEFVENPAIQHTIETGHRIHAKYLPDKKQLNSYCHDEECAWSNVQHYGVTQP